jgi:hypothetical protein
MSDSRIQLGAATATTEPIAIMQAYEQRYNSITVKWRNASTSSSIYRVNWIEDGSPLRTGASGNITVPANSDFQYKMAVIKVDGVVVPLSANTMYAVTLSRYEYNTWVVQVQNASGDTQIKMNTRRPVLRAYGVKQGLVAVWAAPSANPPYTYQLRLAKGTAIPTASTSYIQTIDMPDTERVTANGNDNYSYEWGGLDNLAPYIITFLVKNEDTATAASGITGITGWTVLGHSSVSTVTEATISVVKVRAGNATLWWSGADDSVYRVIRVNADGTPGPVLLPGRVGAPTKAVPVTITGLAVDTQYTIRVQRQATKSIWNDEGSTSFKTNGSIVTINGTGSSTVNLQFTKAYGDAVYVIGYKVQGSAEAEVITPPISIAAADTNSVQTLTGLSAEKVYIVTVYAIELGAPVAVGSVMLGATAAAAGGGRNITIIVVSCLAAAAALAVIAVLARRHYKNKSAVAGGGLQPLLLSGPPTPF